MVNNQIVETFRNLKKHCLSKKDCETCQFYYIKNECSGHCQLEELGCTLAISPRYWNIDEIKKIINN